MIYIRAVNENAAKFDAADSSLSLQRIEFSRYYRLRGHKERNAGDREDVVVAGTQSQEKLDRIDIKIRTARAGGRITNQTLADAVGLSPSPCLQRVKRLERAGVITGYRAHIDLKKVCRHVDGVATIVLRGHAIEDFAGFEEMVGGMPHIVE